MQNPTPLIIRANIVPLFLAFLAAYFIWGPKLPLLLSVEPRYIKVLVSIMLISPSLNRMFSLLGKPLNIPASLCILTSSSYCATTLKPSSTIFIKFSLSFASATRKRSSTKVTISVFLGYS